MRGSPHHQTRNPYPPFLILNKQMSTGWAQLPSFFPGAPEFGIVRERRNNRTLMLGVGQSCSLSLSGPPTSSAPISTWVPLPKLSAELSFRS